MHILALADKLRATLPRPIWEICRKAANSLLGPLHFSLETGHFWSCVRSRAVDRKGHPLPWYTYPAIQFLLPKDFSEKRVLEWGGGQSSLFWAERAKEVVVFESDRTWSSRLERHKRPNMSVHLVSKHASESGQLLTGQRFDIIVVDGLDRWLCAEISLNLLDPDGAIIVDDSECNCGPISGCGFIDLYRRAGLSRIDFYGYSPGNSTQHCTSIFFKQECFLIRGGENPAISLSFWQIPATSNASDASKCPLPGEPRPSSATLA